MAKTKHADKTATTNETTEATQTQSAPANVTPAPELTSDKLEQLKADKLAAQKQLQTAEVGSKEFDEIVLNITKIGNDIVKELAHIKQQEREAQAAEERNARIAKRVSFEEALRAEMDYFHGEYQTTKNMEAMNALTAATKHAAEVLDNELLSKKSVSRGTTTNGEAKVSNGGGKGETGKKIIEQFLANRESGMNDTENKKAIVAAGFARGTVGAEVLAWQRLNGEKE